jgi:hypothetical protein
MTMKKLLFQAVFAAGVIAIIAPEHAVAVEYMGLKDAVKHFIPADAKLSKVEKSIPADKLPEIKKKFDLEKSADFNEKITPGPYTFYVGRDGAGKATAYVVVLEQYWRTCYHKYAVGLTPDGKIKEIVVMEFNCKYEYPVNKRSFLKQFDGKATPPKLGKDVDVVTGATASCEATAIVARRALALFSLFFGPGAQ